MAFIADMLLIAGALCVAAYCYVLAKRLKRFGTLESGMGSAIAVLSAQVDDLTKALEQARGTAQDSVSKLVALTDRAEMAAENLEALLGAQQDSLLPEPTDPDRRIRFVRRRATRPTVEAAE